MSLCPQGARLVKRKAPGITDLIAARVRTTRRPPGVPGDAPFLKLVRDDAAPAQVEKPRANLELPERVLTQIRTLTGKLNTVIRKAMSSAVGENEIQVIQACIDKTVDAVANLIHSHRPAGTALYRSLDIAGFFDMRRGGRFDLIKNHLSMIARIAASASTCLAPVRRSPHADEIARENAAASEITQDDLDFAAQISRMTQAEILAQTSNQFRRLRSAGQSPTLETFSNE